MTDRLNKKRRFLATIWVLVLVSGVFDCLGFSVRAQSTKQDWEKAAGGKQQFEVASVRENKSGGPSYSNFSLDNGNAYFIIKKNDKLDLNGTLFSAKNQTLMRYIIFAYKLSGTQELALRFDYFEGLQLHVPQWVKDDRYDIEARAPEPATKDQLRLMMQSLLAERFKLKVHNETREAPVFALVLEKPGKLGPQLEQHKADDDCNATAFPEGSGKGAAPAQSLSALPIPCGQIAHLLPGSPGANRFGGRNVTLALLGTSMPTQTGLLTLPRPVLDETGLKGGFDFWLEWTPEDLSEVDNGETGGTFREALKNQLGLKLERAKGSVQVLVIDHVERQTAN
ncbi:MAG: TIGR03435 family protein [Terracidiphilus sp.]